MKDFMLGMEIPGGETGAENAAVGGGETRPNPAHSDLPALTTRPVSNEANFRTAGTMAGIALARHDRATRQVHEEWLALTLRRSQPAHRRQLTLAFIDGMDASRPRLVDGRLVPPADIPEAWKAHEPETLALRLLVSLQAAQSLPRSADHHPDQQPTDLRALGLATDDVTLLNLWAIRQGINLQLPPRAVESPISTIYWPSCLLVNATRIHADQFGIHDLPPAWTAWVLTRTMHPSHQLQPTEAQPATVCNRRPTA